MSGGSTEAFTSDVSLATELIWPPTGRLHPQKLSWSWNSCFVFVSFSTWVARSHGRDDTLFLLRKDAPESEVFRTSSPAQKRYPGEKLCPIPWSVFAQGDGLKSFFVFCLHCFCCNSCSRRTFCTIQDANFISKQCSTSTDYRICGRLGRWHTRNSRLSNSS